MQERTGSDFLCVASPLLQCETVSEGHVCGEGLNAVTLQNVALALEFICSELTLGFSAALAAPLVVVGPFPTRGDGFKVDLSLNERLRGAQGVLFASNQL